MLTVLGGNSASTGYNLTRSLRFRSSASATLGRTFASGNRKTWTLSFWVKRGSLGSNQNILVSGPANTTDATFANIGFSSSNTFTFTAYSVAWRTTTQVFRDPSAWYHIVVAWDTTQATASNRVKIYVNGTQVTAFSSTFDPSLNFDGAVNQAAATYISLAHLSYGCFDGYLAETYFIDGQALTPTSFGSYSSTTGVWQPARYSGTYGTNGAYLPFTDNSALTTSSNVGLGKDFSGNGNYWVTTNISITSGVTYDSMTDVPTLTSATAANYTVLNPLDRANTNLVTSNANMVCTNTGGTGNAQIRASIALPSTGKFYWETKNTGSANNFSMGLTTTTASLSTEGAGDVLYNENGVINNNGTTTSGFATLALNDIVGVAVDVDANKIYFYKNNTLVNSGGTTINISAPFAPMFGFYTTNNAQSVNFGQQPFAYTPPSGFVALNTFNLPTSTILQGNTVMDINLWAGTGATNVITNAAGFKPDLVWGKSRTNAYEHALFDSVRGANKQLASNSTAAEVTQTQGLLSFNSNGFTLGTSSDSTVNNAGSGQTYVGWQWQAGQGTTSSNTNGSITSTVSVNASAGFSVVTYTGTGANATVGHGLGVAPSLIITKPRNSADNWISWHTALGATGYIYLNLTNASATAATVWNSTLPSSSVFSIGTSSNINSSGQTQVAYCWTPIAGYSAFGSYAGNGSGDGPFAYLGFRPKFVLIKSTTSANDWIIEDTARNAYNVSNSKLSPNTSGAEFTDTNAVGIDFLSNGFKIRGIDGSINTSNTYIYAAFAESPFRNALAR
jgi:hypothetical protein